MYKVQAGKRKERKNEINYSIWQTNTEESRYYPTYLYVEFALPEGMSEFHFLSKSNNVELLKANDPTTSGNWKWYKTLDSNQPPNEKEKEHLPTSEGLVSASFHGLHGSYWKSSELKISTTIT